MSCTALCLPHVLTCLYRTGHSVHNFSSIASPSSSSSFSSPIPPSSTAPHPPRPPPPNPHLTGYSVAPHRGNCAGDSRRDTLTNCSSQPLDCDRRRCAHGFYDCTQLLPAPWPTVSPSRQAIQRVGRDEELLVSDSVRANVSGEGE